MGTGSYLAPKLIEAGQVNLNTGTEPRNLSDIINFTQKANLAESQLTPLTTNWEQALTTVNRYIGTTQIYKEACTRYFCPGGPPTPTDFQTTTIAVGTHPDGVGANPATNKIFVSNYQSNSVSVIDGGTNTVTTTVSVGSFPLGVGVNPTTNKIYVANTGGNSVSVIDGNTNSVTATVTVGTQPNGVAVNPSTNRVYVVNEVANTVSVIDGNTNTVTATISVGSFPTDVAVDPITNKAFVPNFGSNSVSVIDGSTNTVTATVTVGTNPVGIGTIALTGTDRIYTTNQGSNSVSVIDGASNTVIASIPVGSMPDALDVNPTSNRAYAANFGSSSVSSIDVTTNTVSTTVSVGAGPTGVAVNLSTNKVYVTNQNTNNVSVLERREEIREACLAATNCLVVSSVGILFPGTPQATSVSLVAASLSSNATKTGTQMTLTILCDNNTTNPSQQCSAFYIEGNVWGPRQTDLTKSPLLVQNGEPYFYLQFHWWDFANSRIVPWDIWWYSTASNPKWYWNAYWWWRTYVNYYIGTWLPWWWWVWHWTYWRYWAWWSTNSP